VPLVRRREAKNTEKTLSWSEGALCVRSEAERRPAGTKEEPFGDSKSRMTEEGERHGKP